MKEAHRRPQRTLKKHIEFSGIGIHTGRNVHMRFCPAKEGTGIQFRRTDLPGHPTIPATVEYVIDTSRNTTIGLGDIRIHTIEHVMAALRANDIDNLYIELSNIEPPVGNGSSDIFVEMIEKAGILDQQEHVPVLAITEPVYWSDSDIHIVAIPHDTFKVSYTLNYPECKALKSQYFSFQLSSDSFKSQIAPCRTFSLYEEVSMLMDRGLIKGGSLDNAVVIKDDIVFSKGGLFFPNEMVRHKVLDLIGDLSLVGFPLLAHIIAVRSGHASNFAFAKKILNTITMESN